jgi:hypothetical protein
MCALYNSDESNSLRLKARPLESATRASAAEELSLNHIIDAWAKKRERILFMYLGKNSVDADKAHRALADRAKIALAPAEALQQSKNGTLL